MAKRKPKAAPKTVRIMIPVQVSRDGSKVFIYVPENDRPDKIFRSKKSRKAEERAVINDHWGDGPPPSVVWVEADIPIPDEPPPAPVVKGKSSASASTK